jgi:hypothetical protein
LRVQLDDELRGQKPLRPDPDHAPAGGPA